MIPLDKVGMTMGLALFLSKAIRDADTVIRRTPESCYLFAMSVGTTNTAPLKLFLPSFRFVRLGRSTIINAVADDVNNLIPKEVRIYKKAYFER